MIYSIGYAQPANDNCASATALISSTVCNTTNGTMRTGAAVGTTATATAGIAATCGYPTGAVDVWYRFQAQSRYPVITLGAMGTSLDNNPGIAIYSDAGCTAALLNANLLGCVTGTNVIAPATLSLDVEIVVGSAGLTVGQFYKIRVMTSATATTATPTNWNFNICVQDRLSNDDCDGAITLPVGGGCGNMTFTVVGSTLSTGIPSACAGGYGYDVWFKFRATTVNPTIEFSGFGANFTNRRMQLYRATGTGCGTLTSVACITTSPYNSAGLTVGAMYYIRVYSTTGPAPTTAGNFNICVWTIDPPPRYGNGYVNISKRNNGGIVQNGDTLEIRFTVNTGDDLFSARFVDNVPTNTTMLSLPADSIRVITNEGLTFRRYTPLTTADAGTYIATPPAGHYNVRVNLGFGVGAPSQFIPTAPLNNSETDITGAARIQASDRPRGGGGVLFAIAYRVRVTGNPGDTIKFRTGKFIYKTTAAGTDIQIPTTQYQILVSSPINLCANSVGLNAAGESSGTFGAGSTPSRPSDLESPIGDYALVDIAMQGINDGTYSVIKNVSPTSSILPNARKQPNCAGAPVGLECTNRMHGGYWDITGDHTGTNNAIGNAPPAAATSAGYMMIVNADWVASEVFRQRLTDLCPSTYYEFSAWVKNVCTACGSDSAAAQTYRPGVLPNMTFALDGIDRYSTGQVDTLGWMKKGFVFITGDTQTTVTFSIRNNSQGGGGNDWAMDDIGVATCMPNMAYSPSANPSVCTMNARTIYDTVRSFFNNYVYYVWQRSTDGGTIWSDLSSPQGPTTPTFNVARQSWEYLTHFVVPPAWTTLADNGDLYRVVAATTVANLGTGACVFTDAIPFLTMNVMNCGTPLKIDLLSFNGKLDGDYADLTWTTSKEDEPVKYQLERSTDGSHFSTVGTISGYNNNASENVYTYNDPEAVVGKIYYRVVIINNGNNKKYSRTISLSKVNENNFELRTVVNPFSNSLYFDISAPGTMKIEAEIMDMNGTVVKRKTYLVHQGVNMLQLPDTGTLPGGNYIFRVKNNNQILSKKIVKGNNL
jgi:hypothetical protein